MGTLADPQIQANPNAFFAAIRRQAPVYFDEKIAMHLVSRYDDVQTVLRDAETYSVEQGYSAQYAKGFADEFKQILIRDGGGFFPDVIKTDPPYHTRIRRLLDQAFTAHRVATLEPRITDVAAGLVERLAEAAGGGRVVDAVSEFAVPVTTSIICEQLGFQNLDPNKVQRWSLAVVAQLGNMQDRATMQQHAADICELQHYLIARIREREAEPREDMISDLVHARTEDGERLTFEEVVPLARAMLIAGNETTAIALTNLMLILATRPEVARLLRDAADDDRLLARFVEELLRYDPPTRGLARMTTRETELGGVRLPKGAHLLVLFASANDDETQFACPRDFDLNRPNLGQHFTFGAGIHRCVGSALSRMEIKVVAREVVRRLQEVRLAIAPEQVRYHPTVVSHVIAELPISVTRRGSTN
jgi:cytochrome P450